MKLLRPLDDPSVFRDAEIDGIYRYKLTRFWRPHAPKLAVIMFNPSTADAYEDDPTILKVCHHAAAHGYGGVMVFNLFAFRATQPKDLFDAISAHGLQYAIGPKNLAIIGQNLRFNRPDILLAWGALAAATPRVREHAVMLAQGITKIAKRDNLKVFTLALTKKGIPAHPLYLLADAKMQPFAVDRV